jgi:cell wall-associated NlpC family hydrolase
LQKLSISLSTAVVAAVCVPAALASPRTTPPDWAAPQIRQVTAAGVLGRSAATFRPQAGLTQAALAAAIARTDALQHPPTPPPAPAPAAPSPQPLALVSTVPAGAVLAGTVSWSVAVANGDPDEVALAVDGKQVADQTEAPFGLQLDTTGLADGPHQLAVRARTGDGYASLAVWTVTVANAPGSALTPLPAVPVAVPVVSATTPPPPPPAEPQQTAAPATVHTLYRAAQPAAGVTVKQLDAALVSYLGLAPAASEIQATLRRAGLQPPAGAGAEAVARMLGLRLDHPAAQDALELLPNQTATRAEAAWSFAHVLQLSDWQTQSVAAAAQAFTLPALGTWQRRILTTAVHYVGYPYVWGGTSPGPEVEFGVHSVGGFDCSGFVWRVYKLTSYPGEGRLASVLRGRTTYQMSGEVPRRLRIPASKLQPGDVMFFGHGPHSSPSVVDHAAIYLGNGWFAQSSGQGVTVLPFDGWYRESFAWARRPLREAGLT